MKKAIGLLILLLTIGATAFANTPGKHTVSLSWTAPTSGCAAGCTYNVYRATAAGACSGNPTPYATGVTSPAYIDQNPALGSTYFYDVTAVGSGGESACSNELQVQVPAPPGAPSSLSGTVQ